MRPLIFAAGIATSALGFLSFSQIEDPTLLQSALTLGGGWIICGLFSLKAPWHGFGGAAVLALLGAARCVVEIPTMLRGDSPAVPFQAAALGISAVVLVATVRALLAERARRQRESLDGGP